jgi:hypothetical protein
VRQAALGSSWELIGAIMKLYGPQSARAPASQLLSTREYRINFTGRAHMSEDQACGRGRRSTMSNMKSSILVLRWIMEAGIVLALAYWGARTGGSTIAKILLAIGAPVVGFGFWGLVDFRWAGRGHAPGLGAGRFGGRSPCPVCGRCTRAGMGAGWRVGALSCAGLRNGRKTPGKAGEMSGLASSGRIALVVGIYFIRFHLPLSAREQIAAISWRAGF